MFDKLIGIQDILPGQQLDDIKELFHYTSKLPFTITISRGLIVCPLHCWVSLKQSHEPSSVEILYGTIRRPGESNFVRRDSSESLRPYRHLVIQSQNHSFATQQILNFQHSPH